MVNDKKPDDDKPGLEQNVQAQLGEKLKEVYSDVINEPVPDRFIDLLNQLEKSENPNKSES